MSASQSLPPSYFDALYEADPDPWKFATSKYEANKYEATMAALPKSHYRAVLEIGGSIGILTQKLARQCNSLLSIDVSAVAQAQAIEYCKDLPQVRFQIMSFPQHYPMELFDLILVSEVGYYWCLEDLQIARQKILELLEPGGNLLLVHWLPTSPDYPLTGDEVHEEFLSVVPAQIKHIKGEINNKYRLDLFERV